MVQRRAWLVFPLASGLLAACAQAARRRPGYGIVIRAEAAPGAKEKTGVLAVSDTGHHLFAFGALRKQAGTLSYGGAGLPEWIRVTWKEGDVVYDPGTANWSGGKVVADHRVDIASRIPAEVSAYAAGSPGRAVRLIVRIADDRVLLAWDVQETVKHPRDSDGQWVYSLHGGDFPCVTSPYQPQPNCTEGPLEQAPWYNSLWIRT